MGRNQCQHQHQNQHQRLSMILPCVLLLLFTSPSSHNIVSSLSLSSMSSISSSKSLSLSLRHHNLNHHHHRRVRCSPSTAGQKKRGGSSSSLILHSSTSTRNDNGTDNGTGNGTGNNNFSKSNIDLQPQLQPQSQSQSMNDMITITKHFAFCFLISLVLSFYEGYDCSYLKPLSSTIRHFPPSPSPSTSVSVPTSVSTSALGIDTTFSGNSDSTIIQDIVQLMKSGTRGMGRGEIDRMDGWFQSTYFGDDEYSYQSQSQSQSQSQTQSQIPKKNDLRTVQSYNEVMKYHREQRVQRWKDDKQRISMMSPSSIFMKTNTNINDNDNNNNNNDNILKIQNAIGTIYEAINQLQTLKALALDYEWDDMMILIKSDLFTLDLETSCNILRSSIGYIDLESRQEIGFDWGR
jgi:hypothetical protein